MGLIPVVLASLGAPRLHCGCCCQVGFFPGYREVWAAGTPLPPHNSQWGPTAAPSGDGPIKCSSQVMGRGEKGGIKKRQAKET